MAGLPAAFMAPDGGEWTWEQNVLPVFYYNDLLVSRPGEGVGLNFFEPRYCEMCRRMATDPRFLFMPNYEDYSCRMGDVGFVIRVTSMVPQRAGGGYGVQGVAERPAAVRCTWVEPDTRGLHFASFWSLDPGIRAMGHSEMHKWIELVLARGWGWASPREIMYKLRCPSSPSPWQLLLGLNWPGCVHVIIVKPTEEEEDEEQSLLQQQQLQEAWADAMQALGRPRATAGSDFLARMVHEVSGADGGVQLAAVSDTLFDILCAEGRGVPGVEVHRPRQRVSSEEHQCLWEKLLHGVRLSAVGGMSVELPSAQLTVFTGDISLPADCFPRHSVHWRRGAGTAAGTAQELVRVDNGTNVFFVVGRESAQVLPESAKAVQAKLIWRLNRMRWRVLLRARDRGMGPLAVLRDGAAQLVRDFISPPPPGEEDPLLP